MATQIFQSDLDLMFNIHPIKKDLVISNNEQAIIRSIKNLVLTNHYERPFQSEIGSNISKMLFENFSSFTANYLEKEIYDVITIYEPRISQLSVEVKAFPDENTMSATITFYIENSTVLTVIDLLLERTR